MAEVADAPVTLPATSPWTRVVSLLSLAGVLGLIAWAGTEVYLAMTRGQESLIIGLDDSTEALDDEGGAPSLAVRPPLKVVTASADELAAHAAQLKDIADASQGQCLWLPAAADAG